MKFATKTGVTAPNPAPPRQVALIRRQRNEHALRRYSELYLGPNIHDFSRRIAGEEEPLPESSRCRCPFRELVRMGS
ncbi:hypothetical protein AJ87_47605 [Rhizobium yanglingense]|nr:hypothetical protein AJ87_47605 [Rhizobium yanglingense]